MSAGQTQYKLTLVNGRGGRDFSGPPEGSFPARGWYGRRRRRERLRLGFGQVLRYAHQLSTSGRAVPVPASPPNKFGVLHASGRKARQGRRPAGWRRVRPGDVNRLIRGRLSPSCDLMQKLTRVILERLRKLRPSRNQINRSTLVEKAKQAHAF